MACPPAPCIFRFQQQEESHDNNNTRLIRGSSGGGGEKVQLEEYFLREFFVMGAGVYIITRISIFDLLGAGNAYYILVPHIYYSQRYARMHV